VSLVNEDMSIAGRFIGPSHLPLIIAEIGINHGGSLDVAIEMAGAAIDAGAEVIKHQTHIPEDEMSIEARSIVPPHTSSSIYDIIAGCALDENDEKSLKDYVESRGAIFLSTPFSRAAVDRLERLGVDAYKVGSGECNNLPLLEYIAAKNKPVILSTGMNSLDNVHKAVEIFERYEIPFALLHCTNIYPTAPEHVRLGAILEMQKAFPGVIVGLSDHTTTIYPCLGAVALGASILERHFTDSFSREGPDISCSMDPEQLRNLIEGSRIIFAARGGKKGPLEEERGIIEFAHASVVAIKNIDPGEVLSTDNIWVKRPGTGDFSASEFQSILGKVAKSRILAGSQLSKNQI
jgi:N-acetylneuraminate synthase